MSVAVPPVTSSAATGAAATAARPVRGLLDTSVVIALERISLERLPDEPAVSALTVAELAAGRSVRGRRAVDLMVAATALAEGLPLYTLDADDLRGLEGLVDVVELGG